MPEILCPNCRVMVTTGVNHPQDVVCNGRGEHVVSAEPMDAKGRAEHLRAMDRGVSPPSNNMKVIVMVESENDREHVESFSEEIRAGFRSLRKQANA